MISANDGKADQNSIKTIFKAEGECLEVDMAVLPDLIFVDTTFVTKNSYIASTIEDGCSFLDLSSIDKTQNSNQMAINVVPASSIVHLPTKPVIISVDQTSATPVPVTITAPAATAVPTISTSTMVSTATSSPTVPVSTKLPVKDSGTNVENNSLFNSKKCHRITSSKSKSFITQIPGDPSYRNKAEAWTCTESPNPKRDRSIQTEATNSKTSVGVQCNLADDIDADDFYLLNFENSEEDVDIKADFLKFVKENIQTYSPNSMECCICGETRRSMKSIEKHMALHFGPAALCYNCGIYLEHEIMLDDHACLKKKRYREMTRLLKNPCTNDRYTSIMPLKRKITPKCKVCNQFHKTLISRILGKNKVLLNTQCEKYKATSGLICEICLNVCTNKIKYKNHRQRCLKKYLRILKNKRKICRLKTKSP